MGREGDIYYFGLILYLMPQDMISEETGGCILFWIDSLSNTSGYD
jgi:hypothetical protein